MPKSWWSVLFLLLLFPQTARAIEGINLVTSPVAVKLEASPGKSVTTELRVRNAGSQTERLKVGLLKFRAFGDTSQPIIEDPTPEDEFVKWVTLAPNRFSLDSGTWQTVKMTITIPTYAANGYYYAVTFARDQEQSEPSTAKIAGANAILVLLNAQNPDAKRSIELDKFFTTKPFYEFLPAEFAVRLANRGDVHLAPAGNIFISQGKKQIATLSVNRTLGQILPGSKRLFETNWQDGFPVYIDKVEDGKVVTDDKGKPKRQLRWDVSSFSKFRFGKYTAHLVMVYDDGKRDVPIEAKLDFWVIPWRLLLFVLLVVLLFAAGVLSIIRSIVRKARRRSRG